MEHHSVHLNIPVKLVDVDKTRKAISLCTVQFYDEIKKEEEKYETTDGWEETILSCLLCCKVQFCFYHSSVSVQTTILATICKMLIQKY